jgi:hypothetical protein
MNRSNVARKGCLPNRLFSYSHTHTRVRTVHRDNKRALGQLGEWVVAWPTVAVDEEEADAEEEEEHAASAAGLSRCDA